MTSSGKVRIYELSRDLGLEALDHWTVARDALLQGFTDSRVSTDAGQNNNDEGENRLHKILC